MKFLNAQKTANRNPSRSRKGAWIEMLRQAFMLQRYYVAPVRERGLKYNSFITLTYNDGRSRKGAWIEMQAAGNSAKAAQVAPVRERGLKSILISS